MTRCSLTSRSHAVGVELAQHHDRRRRACARASANASGPEWYSGPVVRWTSSPCSRPSSPSSANDDLGGRSSCAARPSACRWCPTCRSSARRRRAASRVGSSGSVVGLRAASTSSQLDAARRRRRRRRRRRPDLRQLVADRGDERRLLGVDDHEGRVGVVDDVLHLVGGEAVRERDRDEAGLAGRVDASSRTSSEFGPHHTRRSPCCVARAPAARAPAGSRVRSARANDVADGRPPPAASTMTAACRRRRVQLRVRA